MEWVIDFQSLFLIKNSPILPLAALAYSFVNSWHCSLMCGPAIHKESKSSLHSFFLWRLLSYSAAGAAFGFFGQSLLGSLEFEVVRIFAFLVFAFVTVLFIVPSLWPNWIRRFSPTRFRGALMAFVPCHLLGLFYGLAIMSGSAWLGGFLLFGHSIMTMPSLAWSWSGVARKAASALGLRLTLKLALVGATLFNLLYFGARIFYPGADVESFLLFCL